MRRRSSREHDPVDCVVVVRPGCNWTLRTLLVATAIAVLSLFAFVAESRADDFAVTTSEAVLDTSEAVFDPDTSSTGDPSLSDDGTTTPAPDDGTTLPPPDDGTTLPPPDVTPPPIEGGPATPPHDPPPGVGITPVEPSVPAGLSPDAQPAGGLGSITLASVLGGGGRTGIDTSGSAATQSEADSHKSANPEQTPSAPQAPHPEKPFNFGGFGGVFGGSAGGAGGAAMGFLAAMFGLFAFAQLFGSRLSTSTTPLRGAAPAFQLKRPG